MFRKSLKCWPASTIFALALSCASLYALPAKAAQTLTVGHIGIVGSQQQKQVSTIIAYLEQRLPGRFRIENKGGSTLGGELDIWEGLRLGAVDVAILTTGALTPEVPQLGVLSVPFLFRDSDHVDKVLHGPIGREIGKQVNAYGVVFLGFAEHGFRHLSNSRRPVQKPDDIKGLRIRVIPNPVFEATFKALGADVVPMAWPAVYGALDDGRIDGQENPLMTFSGSHFERVQKHLSLTGHAYSALLIMVNEATYRGLGPDERKVLDEAARKAGVELRPILVAQDNDILADLKRKGVVVIDDIDRAAFGKLTEPLWPTWERQFGADLLRRIRETR